MYSVRHYLYIPPPIIYRWGTHDLNYAHTYIHHTPGTQHTQCNYLKYVDSITWHTATICFVCHVKANTMSLPKAVLAQLMSYNTQCYIPPIMQHSISAHMWATIIIQYEYKLGSILFMVELYIL